MALIKCPECGQDVSTHAITCPHCGYPFKENNSNEDKKTIILSSHNPNHALFLDAIGS